VDGVPAQLGSRREISKGKLRIADPSASRKHDMEEKTCGTADSRTLKVERSEKRLEPQKPSHNSTRPGLNDSQQKGRGRKKRRYGRQASYQELLPRFKSNPFFNRAKLSKRKGGEVHVMLPGEGEEMKEEEE